jgi:hypothetical protein
MPRVKLREMRKSSSTVPTKTDRAVKLPTPTVVRELPRRRGKRHATSRWASRSYCHTREVLLRCSTPRPAGRLTRRAMAPNAVGSSNGLMEKVQKNKNAKSEKTDRLGQAAVAEGRAMEGLPLGLRPAALVIPSWPLRHPTYTFPIEECPLKCRGNFRPFPRNLGLETFAALSCAFWIRTLL